MSVVLRSYKLRVFEDHVRAVPARDHEGCAFAGPGVDLRGPRARAVLAALGPVRAWLEAREPGVALRSLSADLERRRVLVTLAPGPGEERPRVVRFDPPWADELLAAAAEVEARLREATAEALRARDQRAGGSGAASR